MSPNCTQMPYKSIQASKKRSKQKIVDSLFGSTFHAQFLHELGVTDVLGGVAFNLEVIDQRRLILEQYLVELHETVLLRHNLHKHVRLVANWILGFDLRQVIEAQTVLGQQSTAQVRRLTYSATKEVGLPFKDVFIRFRCNRTMIEQTSSGHKWLGLLYNCVTGPWSLPNSISDIEEVEYCDSIIMIRIYDLVIITPTSLSALRIVTSEDRHANTAILKRWRRTVSATTTTATYPYKSHVHVCS